MSRMRGLPIFGSEKGVWIMHMIPTCLLVLLLQLNAEAIGTAEGAPSQIVPGAVLPAMEHFVPSDQTIWGHPP